MARALQNAARMNAHRIFGIVSFVAAFAGVALSSHPARAQSESHPRLRFGVGATAGLVTQTESNNGGMETEISVPGIAVRAGVQLDDHYALYYEGNAAVFLPTVRNGVMFEVTPVSAFSVAAGVALTYFSLLSLAPPTQEAWSLGVPVRLAVNVPLHRAKSGQRLGMSFDVTLTPAYSFGGPNLPSGFQLGSVAGVSFEMF